MACAIRRTQSKAPASVPKPRAKRALNLNQPNQPPAPVASGGVWLAADRIVLPLLAA